jgi:hypothetical protein
MSDKSKKNFLTPTQCAEQFRLYAASNPSADSQHSLRFCADFLDEFCKQDAQSSLAAPTLLDDVELALTKINEARGYFLIGKIASGKNMLGDGKAMLEEIIQRRETTSSNDQAQRPTGCDR